MEKNDIGKNKKKESFSEGCVHTRSPLQLIGTMRLQVMENLLEVGV